MPIGVSTSVNSTADKFGKLPGVNKLFSNPVYLSLLLVLIIMLITVIVFRDIDSDTSLVTLTLRTGFWSFVAITGAIFVNNRIMLDEVNKKVKTSAYEPLFEYEGSGQAVGSLPKSPQSILTKQPESVTINFAGL